MNTSEESDGSFGGFWPETFALGACFEAEQVTGRRRQS